MDKIQQLIKEAQEKMGKSTDSIHGFKHVERVVANVKKLCFDLQIKEEQRQAIILAAWWHDTARTITKKTSLLWMPFVDDFISAMIFWRATIQCKLFGDIVGLATRLIFCKTLGAGKLLTKILLLKKDRLLLDILKDADALDVINIERIEEIISLAQLSSFYHFGYKTIIWWHLQTSNLHMKTKAARKYLEQIIRQILIWAKNPQVLAWHIKTFGKKWSEKTLTRIEKLLDNIVLLNLQKSFN